MGSGLGKIGSWRDAGQDVRVTGRVVNGEMVTERAAGWCRGYPRRVIWFRLCELNCFSGSTRSLARKGAVFLSERPKENIRRELKGGRRGFIGSIRAEELCETEHVI